MQNLNRWPWIAWACQVGAAAILAQTLFFKFTGAEESRHIFARLGAEPSGRIASGVVELACVVLLLTPRTAAVGALLAMGVMAGAIVSHVAVLGIEVQGDGGLLFGLALATFLMSAVVVFARRASLPLVGAHFA